MSKKTRLDLVLVEQGLFASREQAQRAVMAGEVKLGDRVLTKSSILIDPADELTVAAARKFVGRGGLKLEGALDHFHIDPTGKIALDIGASTGGFTDCILQRGAAKVYAIDVGHGQLAWKIRKDQRVTVFEKTNARTITPSIIGEVANICVIDVSFISLTLILPNAFQLVSASGSVLALIKPQFELERAEVGGGGIVRDSSLHEKAKHKITSFIEGSGNRVVGISPSSIAGTDGNQEFFICARKPSA